MFTCLAWSSHRPVYDPCTLLPWFGSTHEPYSQSHVMRNMSGLAGEWLIRLLLAREGWNFDFLWHCARLSSSLHGLLPLTFRSVFLIRNRFPFNESRRCSPGRYSSLISYFWTHLQLGRHFFTNMLLIRRQDSCLHPECPRTKTKDGARDDVIRLLFSVFTNLSMASHPARGAVLTT